MKHNLHIIKKLKKYNIEFIHQDKCKKLKEKSMKKEKQKYVHNNYIMIGRTKNENRKAEE